MGSDLPGNIKLLPEPEELADQHVRGFVTRLATLSHSCTVARVSGGKEGHELFSEILNILVAQIVAPARATKQKLQSFVPLGSVRKFEERSTDKPNSAENGHEEEPPDNVVALPRQTSATVQLNHKASGSVASYDTQSATDQPTDATKN